MPSLRLCSAAPLTRKRGGTAFQTRSVRGVASQSDREVVCRWDLAEVFRSGQAADARLDQVAGCRSDSAVGSQSLLEAVSFSGEAPLADLRPSNFEQCPKIPATYRNKYGSGSRQVPHACARISRLVVRHSSRGNLGQPLIAGRGSACISAPIRRGMGRCG